MVIVNKTLNDVFAGSNTLVVNVNHKQNPGEAAGCWRVSKKTANLTKRIVVLYDSKLYQVLDVMKWHWAIDDVNRKKTRRVYFESHMNDYLTSKYGGYDISTGNRNPVSKMYL